MKRKRPIDPTKIKYKKPLAERLGLKYTVMLVPHSEKKPIHLKLPLGAILALALCLTLLLGFTCYFAYSSWRLQSVAAENSGLKKITAEQEEQLEQLEALAAEVLDAAKETGEIENEVREKIGLEPEESILPAYGGTLEVYRPAAYAAGDALLASRIDYLERELTALRQFYGTYNDSLGVLDEEIDTYIYEQGCFPDLWPLEAGSYYSVTSEFGNRIDPISFVLTTHSAMDISAPAGTPIRAAARGVVSVYDSNSGYGKHVYIDHGNGYVTLYAHCSEILVANGATVEKGEVIARVGSTGRATGSHLHFGVLYNGTFINPRTVLATP